MHQIDKEQTNLPPASNVCVEDVSSFFLKELKRHLSQAVNLHIEISGLHSPEAFAIISGHSDFPTTNGLPNVFVFESEDSFLSFSNLLKKIGSTVKVKRLPSFDVSPYSNLYPHHRIIAERLQWLHACDKEPNQYLFLATYKSLQQFTIPYQELLNKTQQFKKGSDFPDSIENYFQSLAYTQVPIVEDPGTFSLRGGILDVYSPAHELPIRIELFGSEIESLRSFDPDTQKSLSEIDSLNIVPAREVFFTDANQQKITRNFHDSLTSRNIKTEEGDEFLQNLSRGQYFHGIEFLLSYFYEKPDLPLNHFSTPINLWMFNPSESQRSYDNYLSELKEEHKRSFDQTLLMSPEQLYSFSPQLNVPEGSNQVDLEHVPILDANRKSPDIELDFKTFSLTEFQSNCKSLKSDKGALNKYVREKLLDWRNLGYCFFVHSTSIQHTSRLKSLLEQCQFKGVEVSEEDYAWQTWRDQQLHSPDLIHIVPRKIDSSFRLASEQIIFFKDDNFFGYKDSRHSYQKNSSIDTSLAHLSFDDLKAGDLVVHRLHGVGIYEGLKVMAISGVNNEFMQLKYKDGDKLYLPVHRLNLVQKFMGPKSERLIDKLGGTGWEKAKIKVKAHLQDIASQLLKLYAKRSQLTRPAFSFPDDDFLAFEDAFPFEETTDQEKAIADVISDMTSERPMDRLICGDVGFGKTEVAMRAAFKAAQDGFQVAVIAPTTVLTFQHTENFRKRFKDWPISIKPLNRFVSSGEVKKTLQELKEGSLDIVIGTHRLLSKDINFKKLGLLVIDEEQKFGVKHKEKIRMLKSGVDTLTMSATPIPRTLNLSLVGLRDLSLINSAPVDRLPTRTFVSKFDKETIRKAVESEVKRGGQVFFLHNRVNSIYGLADDLKSILPNIKIAVGHGQMDEKSLEKTVLAFFRKEVDMLVCTTIIESGIDIPNANTMFIDNAHAFGLSQLYQLRGRVGRSKERAYCYLIVPGNKKIEKEAQERLRVIQENTALGSGIRIAQHDLELRGAGDILGQEQSGHINAVGYELYMELLEQAVSEQKGDGPTKEVIDPEVNLRIPAFIPDTFIPDIRVRLNFYKVLSDIQSEGELDQIEDDMRDQFGKLPEEVVNLFGVMLIKSQCKKLGVKDLSVIPSGMNLVFSESTPLSVDKVLELTKRPGQRYVLTPDSKLKVRIKEVTWPRVYEELNLILQMV